MALQLSEGGRVQGTFPVATSIWDVLLYYEKQSNGKLNLTRQLSAHVADKKRKLQQQEEEPQETVALYQQPVISFLQREVLVVYSYPPPPKKKHKTNLWTALVQYLGAGTILTHTHHTHHTHTHTHIHFSLSPRYLTTKRCPRFKICVERPFTIWEWTPMVCCGFTLDLQK